jgi:hypothetical protein
VKVLFALAVGVWLGYYKATQRHIWNDYVIVWESDKITVKSVEK